MSGLAEFGKRMKIFYARWSVYLDMLFKLALALASFIWIRAMSGYSPLFSNVFLLLVLAILCMVLPLTAVPVFDGILIVGQAFSVGLDAGAVAIALYLVLLILFLRFVPDDAWEAAAMPVLTWIGLPVFLPVWCGLKRKPYALLAVDSGIVLYGFVRALHANAGKLRELGSSAYASRLKLIIGGTFSDRMVVLIFAATAVIIMVYSVRNLPADNAFLISVPVGGAVYLAFILLGNAVLHTGMDPVTGLIGAVAACLLAGLLEAMDTPLDYRKSERLQFEDDEYYYYVKAVPKFASDRGRSFHEVEELMPGEKRNDDGPDKNAVDYEQKLEDSLKNL